MQSVVNPLTWRPIKVHGPTFSKLLSEGWKYHEETQSLTKSKTRKAAEHAYEQLPVLIAGTCITLYSENMQETQVKVVSLLGRGGSSDCYLVTYDGGGAAAKRYRPFWSESRVDDEIEFLSTVKCDALPQYIGKFRDKTGGGLWMLMEYCKGIPLSKHLRTLPEIDALRIIYKTAVALQQIHAAGYIHGDVKPSNIVVDGESVRLIDVGLASPIGILHGRRGTKGFIAPELKKFDKCPAHPSLDVYALGKTLLAMYSASNNTVSWKIVKGCCAELKERWSLDHLLEFIGAIAL